MLGESGERLHAIAESLEEGLLITDGRDVVIYINSRMAELTGYSAEELIGQQAYRLLLPQDQWDTMLEKNKPSPNGFCGHP